MSSDVYCPQGREALERMTGSTLDPEGPIWAEYCTCLRFYHRNGATGPLPTSSVIDLLRRLGVEPIDSAQDPHAEIDWNTVDGGTVVIVEDANGEKHHGEFLQCGSVGCLYVKREDTGEYVHEVPRRMVSLETDSFPELDKKSIAESMEPAPTPRTEHINQEIADSFSWEAVDPGSRIVVHDDAGFPIYGEFVQQEDGKLTVVIDSKLEHYEEKEVSLA